MRSYKDIHNILLGRIKSGEWAPGVLVPSEADLAKEFGCTRVTVNRAMQALAEAGFVERRRKAGTRVIQRMSRNAVFRIPIIRYEIEKRGGSYKYLLISCAEQAPPQRVRAEMALTDDDSVLHVVSLHLADGRPYQLEDRWIDLTTVPQARQGPFDSISPNEWLLREIPYSNAEHLFCAAQPSTDEKEQLDLAENEPVFVIERTTWLAERSVTHVRLVHPANSFRLVTRDSHSSAI
ncbi:MAG: UTRA domain-containing protein [Pseudomonadota bacterium]